MGPVGRLSAAVVDRGVGEKVGDAMERRLFAYGQLERRDSCAERLLEIRQRTVERGTVPVQLVHEHETAESQLAGEAPRCEGLRLDALDRAHDEHDEIDHRARGPHLSEEIGVSGGVDEVDLHVADREGGHRERHRKVPLYFFGLEVRDGVAVLDPALPGDRARLSQEGIGQSRLARSVVADEGHVADPRRWVARHGLAPPWVDRRLPGPPGAGAYRHEQRSSGGWTRVLHRSWAVCVVCRFDGPYPAASMVRSIARGAKEN